MTGDSIVGVATGGSTVGVATAGASTSVVAVDVLAGGFDWAGGVGAGDSEELDALRLQKLTRLLLPRRPTSFETAVRPAPQWADDPAAADDLAAAALPAAAIAVVTITARRRSRRRGPLWIS